MSTFIEDPMNEGKKGAALGKLAGTMQTRELALELGCLL